MDGLQGFDLLQLALVGSIFLLGGIIKGFLGIGLRGVTVARDLQRLPVRPHLLRAHLNSPGLPLPATSQNLRSRRDAMWM